MSLAGRLIMMKEQMKKKPCSRCGYQYDPLKKDKCPRCGDLDEIKLQALLEKIEVGHQSRKWLGKLFFALSLIIVILMLLIIRSR